MDRGTESSKLRDCYSTDDPAIVVTTAGTPENVTPGESD